MFIIISFAGQSGSSIWAESGSDDYKAAIPVCDCRPEGRLLPNMTCSASALHRQASERMSKVHVKTAYTWITDPVHAERLKSDDDKKTDSADITSLPLALSLTRLMSWQGNLTVCCLWWSEWYRYVSQKGITEIGDLSIAFLGRELYALPCMDGLRNHGPLGLDILKHMRTAWRALWPLVFTKVEHQIRVKCWVWGRVVSPSLSDAHNTMRRAVLNRALVSFRASSHISNIPDGLLSHCFSDCVHSVSAEELLLSLLLFYGISW